MLDRSLKRFIVGGPQQALEIDGEDGKAACAGLVGDEVALTQDADCENIESRSIALAT